MPCKISAIRELLKNDSAALIYSTVSRRYLTGFESSLGYLFITKEKAALFVDGRYFEAAEKAADDTVKVYLFDDIGKRVKEFLPDSVKALLVETSVSVATVKSFERMFGLKIKPSESLEKTISNLRSVKADDEIECIIKAQRIAENAFDHILGFIRPGVSENMIAAELEYRMKLSGSTEPSFKTIAVSGEKSSMPHGVPDERLVQKGDFVTMDFGAVWNGYHSDMTRTVAVGFVTDEMRLVYETVLSANLAALDAVCEDVTAAEVDLAARNIIEAKGFGKQFSHSTGHGVGLEIHEQPTVSFKNQQFLKAGQVITIEPGIYLPSKFGVRIEDMAVVTKNGCNNLTKADKKLIIL